MTLLFIINILVIFFINILVIYGVYAAFSEGMILYPLKVKLNAWIGKRAKPIYSCPICMSSVWGTIGFIFLNHFYGVEWWYLPVYVLALAGAIFLIIQFIPE